MYSSSQKFVGKAITEAIAQVGTYTSNLGGTDIYEALKGAINLPSKDVPRYIYLITDGMVYNNAQIIGLVRENTQNNRFFATGLGNYINPELIQGIAMAGNGDYDYV